MRSILICCALMAPLSGYARAQTTSDIIVAEKRNIDFGDVTKASKTEHRFELRNPFKTEMRISGVRASCGCTTPILESQVIQPGQATNLIAHFNTDRFNGEKKATLTVSVTQPIFAELQLNVKGYIRSDVVVSPGEAMFGSIPETTDKKITLTVDYAGKPDWKIQDVTSPLPFAKATFKENSRANGRVQYSIDLTIDGSAPEGFVANQLVVQTNDQRRKSFPIAFSATVDKPLKTSPLAIALGTVKPGEPIQQRLTMSAKGDFKILEMRSKVAEIRCDLPETAKRVHLLSLTIYPKADANAQGEIKDSLVVITDSDTSKPIEIPLSFTFETEKFVNASPK